MKTKELLQQILDKLNEKDVNVKAEAEPSRFAPPTTANVKTMFRNVGTCGEALYSYESTRGRVVHKCKRDENHTSLHNTIVYSVRVEWYTK